MRTKILLFLLSLLLVFSDIRSQSHPAFKDKFTIGAFNYYPYDLLIFIIMQTKKTGIFNYHLIF